MKRSCVIVLVGCLVAQLALCACSGGSSSGSQGQGRVSTLGGSGSSTSAQASGTSASETGAADASADAKADAAGESADAPCVKALDKDDVRAKVDQVMNGYAPKGEPLSAEIAGGYVDKAYETLQAMDSDAIKDIGRNDSCAWVEFTDGSMMLCIPEIEGARSMSTNEDCSIQTIEPCNDSFGSSSASDLAAVADSADLLDQQSGSWNRDLSLVDAQVTLDAVKTIGSRNDKEIILWSGHGGYQDEIGCALVIGQRLTSDLEQNDAQFRDDVINRRIVYCSNDHLAITSKFVDAYISDLDGAYVHLGACHSGQDSRLADAWLGAGAQVVTGYSDTVTVRYDAAMTRSVIQNLCQKTSGSFQTAEQALERAKNSNGGSDPFGSDRARMVMFGNGGSFRFSGTSGASTITPSSGASTPPTPATGADDYILPDSTTRRYTKKDLSKFDTWKLCLARNEIPARHGFIFDNGKVSKYFKSKNWYKGTLTRREFRSIPGILNDVEEANVATILKMEHRRGSAYVPDGVVIVAQPKNTAKDGYVIPQSDTHRYTKRELKKLSTWGLCLARNEIPARHGFIFDKSDTAEYFQGKTWYKGKYTRKQFRSIPNILNATEEANVQTILEMEEARNSPYLPEQ